MGYETKGRRGILFVYPPAAKACEAPAGIARLAGTLRRHDVDCRIWDANLEGQLALLDFAARNGVKAADVWTRRAARHLEENLASLRSWALYLNADRYRRAVVDLNRLLEKTAEPYGVRLSLANYEDKRRSALCSQDLLNVAAEPETSPFYRWFRERLPALLQENPVSHVGFSVNYISQAMTAFAMIGFLRRMFPKIRTVLGGGLVTSWMRRGNWGNRFTGLVDETIAGPGEMPLLALFGTQHDGGPERPDYEGFPLADYLSPGTVLPYSASSGCWWQRCTFCPERTERNPYRPLPPARVSAELRDLAAETGPAVVHFLDNALSPGLLKALILDPPGIPWYGFARVTPHLADPGFCLGLKNAGCVMLKLGIESGDPGVLDVLNKGIDLPTISSVLHNLKAAGIETYVYLLFGTPAETPAAAQRTLDFAAMHSAEIGFLNLAIFNLPASASDDPDHGGVRSYEEDLSLYRRFDHPRGWDRRAVRRFLQKDFRKHPKIAEILKRDPPYFTSNHAPFFTPGWQILKAALRPSDRAHAPETGNRCILPQT